MNCVKCNNELSGQQTRFCSIRCKNKYYQNNSYQKQQERGIKRKDKLIEKSGGKCEICGYNRSRVSLSFHHIDPSEKSFGLDARNISNRSMKSVLEEYKKCQLLCLNCHSELHWEKCDILESN